MGLDEVSLEVDLENVVLDGVLEIDWCVMVRVPRGPPNVTVSTCPGVSRLGELDVLLRDGLEEVAVTCVLVPDSQDTVNTPRPDQVTVCI